MTIVNTTTIQDLDLDSLEFKLEAKTNTSTKKPYVNNKMLYEEYVKYHAKKQAWIDGGCIGKRPPLSNYIGQAILDIANRRCYSRNFIGYTTTWKEEMVSDAIEVCAKYAHNFDPTRYNNPFAYLTQMITNAMKNRIKIEQKELYVKYMCFDQAGGFNAFTDENSSDDNMAESINELHEAYDGYLHYIDDYQKKMQANKEKGKEKIEAEEDLGILEFAS